MSRLAAIKQTLYERAVRDEEELLAAAHALSHDELTPDLYGDFLDFFAIEWVDPKGFTLCERAVAAGLVPAEVAAWPREVRTALWVVDGWEGELVLLRDVATEAEAAVHAPGQQDELPRRSVLRARLLPWEGRLVFSGEPDVYEPMGVIARMDLRRAWEESGEPDLLARLAALRAAFARQREERALFVEFFGQDQVVFDDPDAMAAALAPFVSWLFHEARPPSLGGRTRAQAHRAERGEEPHIVQFALGPSLTGPGRHGVIYDEVEGVHFLPRLGELWSHLRGEASHPEVLRLYLDEPGITALPFRRAGATAALAAFLGRPDAPLDELLAPHKPLGRRVTPSVLPGYEGA